MLIHAIVILDPPIPPPLPSTARNLLASVVFPALLETALAAVHAFEKENRKFGQALQQSHAEAKRHS